MAGINRRTQRKNSLSLSTRMPTDCIGNPDQSGTGKMIYRMLVDECLEGIPTGQGRLVGLMNSHLLSGLMDRLGLRNPNLQNLKARFYFTETGWREVGKLIAGEARRQGHVVKVLRRKEPADSQVVYRDELQLAILPRRAGNKKK